METSNHYPQKIKAENHRAEISKAADRKIMETPEIENKTKVIP
ncbi:hypothetical protein P4S80_13990 [Aeribacillus composti]|jgi:hypothetical protein|nr:hypothetical protein [Aeribacillus composti]MED0746988.1 hypothetical protein [Aeribacillus composti]